MTTVSAERISLRSPAALCCAIPHLLGFHPEHSAVLVWLADGGILLTQRLDLPDHDVPIDAWTTALWSHQGVHHADEVIAVLCVDGTDAGPRNPVLQQAAAAIQERARESSIAVRDVIVRQADRWWSLMCADVDCCPPEGQAIPSDLASRVGALFSADGGPGTAPPLESRDDVVATLDRDEQSAAEIASTGILQRIRSRSAASRERWRDSALANMLAWCSSGAGRDNPRRSAHLLLAVRDIRVRDTLLWELSRTEPEPLRTACAQLVRLLRRAPEGDTAPVASAAALVLWLLGDGVRASAASDRALADDPHYVLAQMLTASITGGLPPAEWRRAMSTLSREACRHGEVLQPGGHPL